MRVVEASIRLTAIPDSQAARAAVLQWLAGLELPVGMQIESADFHGYGDDEDADFEEFSPVGGEFHPTDDNFGE